jgi:predicted RNA binding protein YcfA (HicA-like mRNA interferase family)
MLRANGFEVARITGSHYILKHPARPGVRIVLPWHGKELKRGTLLSILKQAGLNPDDLNPEV